MIGHVKTNGKMLKSDSKINGYKRYIRGNDEKRLIY